MTNNHNNHPGFSPGVQLVVARSGQCREEAHGIIKTHIISSISVGMLPFPIIDGIVLVNVQLNLISRLADHYGVPFTRLSRTMVTSLIAGSLPVLATVAGSSLLKLIPGFGYLAGNAALSTLAGGVTYATGKVFVDHFEAGGTLVDFCPEAFRRQFRSELARSRRAVEQLQVGATT